MEDIVQVDEMTENIFSCPISEPSEKGQENNISWLGTCNWGSGRGVTVKCVQYQEFMFIIISHKRFAVFLRSSTVMV